MMQNSLSRKTESSQSSPLLRVEDMVVVRNGKVCTPSVSFALFRQHILRIFGKNGSGKTSVLMCLAGLTYLQSGLVWMDEDGHTNHERSLLRRTPLGKHEHIPVSTWDVLQNRIAYLPTEQTIQAHLTIREDLKLWESLARKEVSFLSSDIKEHPFPPLAGSADLALEISGLGMVAERLTCLLSSGQKKRLALARLCLKPAKLWLLDEPTNHLDESGIRILADMLKDFIAKGGSVIYAQPLTSEKPAKQDIIGITPHTDYLLQEPSHAL